MSTLLIPALRRFAALGLIAVAGFSALATVTVHAQATPYLYLTNRDGSVVKVIDSAGSATTFLSSGSGLPPAVFGITRDQTGNLFVAVSTNTSTDRIVKITPGGVLSVFASFGTTQSPTGLAFDSQGNLFVGSQGGTHHDIFKITPDGTITSFVTGGSFLNRPFGLAFDADDNLYVANYGSQTIAKFTPGGVGSVFATLPAASNPHGIAFDNNGNLLVVRSNADTVDSITPLGVRTTIASGSIVNNGSGLTFDPVAGLAYLIVEGNKIVELAPDGSSVSLFATVSGISGESLGLVSVNHGVAIPEPSTYAAAAGLLALAAAFIRRRLAAAGK